MSESLPAGLSSPGLAGPSLSSPADLSPWLSAHIRHRVASGPSAFTLDASFTLPGHSAAGWTALFGPSGSGKSTLLRILAGLTRPAHGHIRLFGTPVLYAGSSFPHPLDIPARQRRIALLPQQSALFPHLDVSANVAFGLRHLDRAAKQNRVAEFLTLFRADHLARRRPATLSGGEQQRVALARALATHPRALLLDESLSALDHPTRDAILADLRPWLVRQRTPVLYVTHDLGELFSIASHALIMDGGTIRSQGPPGRVLARERDALLAALSPSPSPSPSPRP